MSIMSRLRGTPYSEDTRDTELAGLHAQVEYLTEAAVDAETQRVLTEDSAGWAKLGEGVSGQFTRQQLRDITARCRLSQWNALIGRGLELRVAYVHGSGVQISARANGPTQDNASQQDVNAVIQAFLDDPANQRVAFSPQAREECERALGTDGNVFLACFTDPVTGAVRVRDMPWDQIADVRVGDDGLPELYLRQWTETTTSGVGAQALKAWYPALRYQPPPRARIAMVGDTPVVWDAPVLHVMVNRPTRQAKFGVPDAYRAVAWAAAYRDFLEDWARLVKSLSKLAWRTTTKGASQQAKAQRALTDATRALAPVGQAMVGGEGATLEAIPKSGATIDSGSGRPLAAMVATALGVPVTMLLGDPGVTGARATAETLDRPTELTASMRRDVWSAAWRELLAYVVDQAALAPRGPLRGTVTVDTRGNETVALAGDTDRTVEVAWPDLTETPLDVLAAAVSSAAALRLAPPLVLLRMMLQALGVDDVDEILEQVTDPETGEFIPPTYPSTPATPVADRLPEGVAQ